MAMNLCVASQTPLVRFKINLRKLKEKYGKFSEPLPLEMLSKKDYIFAPGGITKSLPPLLEFFKSKNLLAKVHWVSLNPKAPELIKANDFILHSIRPSSSTIEKYGRFKESVWKNFHQLDKKAIPRKDFSGYIRYNWLTARKILKLDSKYDFDICYIHDFQLLPLGSMLSCPKLFRWHIPLMIDVKQEWKKFLLAYLAHYDCIVVSCKNYEKELLRAGFEGRVEQIYPYIDPDKYSIPSSAREQEFRNRWKIDPEDKLILLVGRMDPIKGQDIALKALAKLNVEAKLMLVGNGSFSSSKKGLGLPKGLRWKNRLDKLSKNLKLKDNVIFTGYLPHKDLEVALNLAYLLILPSRMEGFGLTVLEAWRYRKPVIVSSGAGIAELIEDGRNGYCFDPSKPGQLAKLIDEILSNPSKARNFGKQGMKTLQKCQLEKAEEKLWKIFESIS